MKFGCQVFLFGKNIHKALKNSSLSKFSISMRCILMCTQCQNCIIFTQKKAAEAAFPTVPKSPFKRNWPFWTMHG